MKRNVLSPFELFKSLGGREFFESCPTSNQVVAVLIVSTFSRPYIGFGSTSDEAFEAALKCLMRAVKR